MANNGNNVVPAGPEDSNHVVPIIPEDGWDFDSDCIFDISLRGENFNLKVLEGKTRKQCFAEIRKAAKDMQFEPHDMEDGFFWTLLQTQTLYNYIKKGSYNLSRIKRIEPVFKNKVMLDIHDRAIMLLILHELEVAKPVEFFHSKKVPSYNMSIRTLEMKTKKFRAHHYFFNGYDGPMSEAPKELKESYHMKIARANAYICDYFFCYYLLGNKCGFHCRYEDVARKFNLCFTAREK